MSKRNKRLLSILLALIAALSPVLAEESPAPDITPEPTLEATLEPTPEPVPEATADATPEPSAEPTIDPTTEPSAEPTPEPSIEPTIEPSASPEAPQFAITPENPLAQAAEGVYSIPITNSEEEVGFSWPAVEGADGYLAELLQRDAEGVETILSSAAAAECRIAFPVNSIAQGRYILRVTAQLGGESIAQAEIQFELSMGQGGFPGGFGGGGRPGGGFSGDMAAGEEQGFRITPGVALTDSHSSGTMNRQLYNAAEIEPSEEAVRSILLNGEEIASSEAFYVKNEDGVLSLIPEGENARWQLSLRALEVLNASGIETLLLGDEGMDTGLLPCGAAYGRLRSQGYVSKDFILTLDADGWHAAVAGESYILHASGELEPLRG
ncbi:MAG: hypothetical protein IJ466_05490 [Clostridia bacterium]|nr:hypothetical protein [Clostridia bacterium]